MKPKLAYTAFGTGPVCIVPSPGWGMPSDYYVPTLAPLTDLFTLVFLDSRGCGRSQAPRTTRQYRYADFAGDIERVRRELGVEKVWVLGHSHAGVQAMRFALDFPRSAAGLLLVGTYAETDAAYNADVERREALRRHESWYVHVDWDSPKTDAELTELLAKALPLYFRDYETMRLSLAQSPVGRCSIHPYRGWTDSEGSSVHILSEVSAIRCPTLLVVGADDFVCSPMNSRRIKKMVAGSRLVVIKEAGHFPWVEQPEAFFRAVRRFVKGCE